MKRFLTCALCFVSLPAIAVTLYYEQGGMCSGLYLSPGCTGTRVTHLSVTPDADTTFTGFKVNGQTIVDANGNVASNASEILRNAGNVGSKIPQSYDCKSGFSKNNNGICVDPSGNTTYVDFENGNEDGGYEISYNEVGGRGGAGSNECVHSKFKVKIHWCPPKYDAYTGPKWENGLSGWNPYASPVVPAGFDYPELWPSASDCNTPDEILYYDWKDRGTSSASYHRDSYTGPLVTEINKPAGKFNDWTLRGFYLLEDDLSVIPSGCNAGTNVSYNSGCYNYWGQRNYFAKRRVVTKTNTEGTARLGLPKPNSNTETGYIDLDDSHDGANGAWSNTRWTVYDCSITHAQAEQKTYHLYAGWARNCVQPDGGTCNLAIRRTGLYQNNNKGDAFYTTTCNGGATPTGNGTYNPICPEKCGLNNLSACGQSECLELSGASWCYVGSFPQCTTTQTSCCVNSVSGCNKENVCTEMGGTWNASSGTCTSGSDGGGSTPTESKWIKFRFNNGSGVTITQTVVPDGLWVDKNGLCPGIYTPAQYEGRQPGECPGGGNITSITRAPVAEGRIFEGFYYNDDTEPFVDANRNINRNKFINTALLNGINSNQSLVAHWKDANPDGQPLTLSVGFTVDENVTAAGGSGTSN